MKMNKAQRNSFNEIRPGTYVTGKWHQHQYVIKRKLGAGAVGAVYLCESNGRKMALKISDQGSSMTVEVNVLKALGKVQGKHLGPNLLDVDDWKTSNGITYSFYVMEYLQGESLATFIRKHGNEWIGVFMLQILDDLERLHKSGWVFGDLKMDNLLVLLVPPRVRLLDVGGTTQIGRAIKEYTEFYDRGYWGMGSRRAEASYDLFAFVMVFLAIFYPKQFQKTVHPEQTIFKKIDNIDVLNPYSTCLKKAILGKYRSSAEMKQDLAVVLHQRRKRKQTNRQAGPNKVMALWIESGGILLLAVCYYLSSILLLP